MWAPTTKACFREVAVLKLFPGSGDITEISFNSYFRQRYNTW